nr:non-ribosomal peptide synthetase [Streptomyces sp.]
MPQHRSAPQHPGTAPASTDTPTGTSGTSGTSGTGDDPVSPPPREPTAFPAEPSPSSAPLSSAPLLSAPLSSAQARLWFLHQLKPASTAYTVHRSATLTGPLDRAALAAAVDALVARHPALRTTVETGTGTEADDGTPRRRVHPPRHGLLDVTDLTGAGPGQARRAAERETDREARHRFDLAAGPLFRPRLLCVAEDEHVLSLTFHHIVVDSWSLGVLQRDLAELYRAAREGRPPELPPLDGESTDGTSPEAAEDPEAAAGYAAQLAYWEKQLDGLPEALDLPRTAAPAVAPDEARTDGGDEADEADEAHRPDGADAAERPEGRECRFVLPAATATRLRQLSAQRRSTLFMTCLAAVQALLSRYTGAEGAKDIVVGFPVAGRHSSRLHDRVGFFVNSLPARTDCSGDPSFATLLGRVRETVLGAMEHQRVPFEELVARFARRREAEGNPLFQVWFDLRPRATPPRLDGVDSRLSPTKVTTTRFDLEFHFEDTGGELLCHLVHRPGVFDEPVVARMAAHCLRLLEHVAAEPETALSALRLGDAAEAELLDRFAAGPAPVPAAARPLVEGFLEQVRARPHAVAVEDAAGTVDYASLHARSDRVAGLLRSRGIGPDDVVALCAPRGAGAVAAVLGILKAGAAHLPVQADQPADRVAYMLRDAGAVLALVGDGCAERLPPQAALPVVTLAEAEAYAEPRDAAAPQPPSAGPDHLMYVLYTSGSTGRPKGVAMRRGALENLVRWQLAGAPEPCRTFHITPQGFDVSVQEVFVTLLSGGTLVVPPPDARRDPDLLHDEAVRRDVRRVFLPPLVLHQLARAALADGRPSPLREFVVAGDRLDLPADTVRFLRGLPGVVVENHYGPTETHVVTAHRLTGPPGDWPAHPPIGRPVAGVRVRVAGPDLRPVPLGVPGELIAEGACLARGYTGAAASGQDRFLPDPHGPGRLYRTGDLARWRPDGTLEHLGRIDAQIKLRGHRIEPGEVEAALRSHRAVADAVVCATGDEPALRHLVGYVVPAGEPPEDWHTELTGFLRGRVPGHMVPSVFVPLDALPVTRTGKVDRRALPAPPARPARRGTAPAAPRDRVERLLLEQWRQALGDGRLGIHDDFFDAGGHSLLAPALVRQAGAALGVRLGVRDLFEQPSVARLAAVLRDRASGGARPAGETGPSAEHPPAAGAAEAASAARAERMRTATLGPGFAVAPDASGPADGTAEPLLTGATGLLGTYLLDVLLRRGTGRVHCLVRAGSGPEAHARLVDRLRAAGRWRAEYGDRVVAVPADLSEPDLGLTDAERDRLADTVGEIHHCAADTHALHTYEQAEPANVGSTAALLRLAARRGVPFHFVSTLAVAPRDPRSGRCVEEWADGRVDLLDSADVCHGSPGYVQSKWVAERLVAQAAAAGLPVTVHRLARLAGDRATGRYLAEDALSELIRAVAEVRCASRLPLTDLWTAVDDAAEWIVRLARRPDRPRVPVYHLPAAAVDLRTLWRQVESAPGTPVPQLDHARWTEVLADGGPATAKAQGIAAHLADRASVPGVREHLIGQGAAVDFTRAQEALGPGADPELPETLLAAFVRAATTPDGEPADGETKEQPDHG